MRVLFGFILFLIFSHANADPMEFDPQTLYLKNALSTLAQFVESPSGQTIFKQDFSAEEFVAKTNELQFEFSNHALTDLNGEERCLLNGQIPNVIQVHYSNECLEFLQNRSIEFYAVLFHEALNQIQVELPSREIGSNYPVSKKLLSLPAELIEGSQKYVIHPTCTLFAVDLVPAGFPYGISNRAYAILRAKGYTPINNLGADEPRSNEFWAITKTQLGDLDNPNSVLLRIQSTFLPGQKVKPLTMGKGTFNFIATLELPHSGIKLRIGKSSIDARAETGVTRDLRVVNNGNLQPDKVARALFLSLPNCVKMPDLPRLKENL